MIYKDAEIYLIHCTHPDFNYVRYIGLDTKKDSMYLGSSIVLKWMIKRIGREYFSKTIIDTVTGSMEQCCAVEQSHILEHDAIANSAYLNLNGKKQEPSASEYLTLDYQIVGVNNSLTSLIDLMVYKITREFRIQPDMVTFAIKVYTMVAYGLASHEQHNYEYSTSKYYGLRCEDRVAKVLHMAACDIIHLFDGSFRPTQTTTDDIDELFLDKHDFTAYLKEDIYEY